MQVHGDGPNAFFTHDHHACDALWAEVEQAVDGGDDATARAALDRFDQALRRHLDMEEHVLFPAIEEAQGMRGFGPVMVMKQEHAQMRALLDQMQHAAEAGDMQDVVDEGDTLLMVIQQHNAKEEGILYPLADQLLDGEWGALKAKLERY